MMDAVSSALRLVMSGRCCDASPEIKKENKRIGKERLRQQTDTNSEGARGDTASIDFTRVNEFHVEGLYKKEPAHEI